MPFVPQEDLLPMIQLSITPVILITGLGSFLLTTTNRLGRIVDRTRILAGQARSAVAAEREHVEQQLVILYRRAKLVRLAVTLAALSMFAAGSLVVVIFVGGLLKVALPGLIVGVFGMSIFLLLGALGAFIRDIFLSLTALSLEVERSLGRPQDQLVAEKTAASSSAKSE